MDSKIDLVLDYIFWMIAGIAAGAIVFLTINSVKFFLDDFKMIVLIGIFIIVPLLTQIFGSIGLANHWFKAHNISAGHAIDILQWVAGVLGSAAIFDAIMRLTRNTQLTRNPVWLTVDVILIILFVMWMVVSYLLNKEEETTGKCAFCR